MGAEIFDRLFQLTEDDLVVVQDEIRSMLLSCRAYILDRPPDYSEALKEADQAYGLALAENLASLYPQINFFRTYCRQGLRRSEADEARGVQEQETVQGLSRKYRAYIGHAAKGDPRRLRRVKAGEDLHAEFFHHEESKAVDGGPGRMLR